MGPPAVMGVSHPAVRRTLIGLSAAYALTWATVSMVAGPGSAALVGLTGRLSYAGVFIALFSVAAAVGAAVGGRAMDRWGRKPVLIAACLLTALGFTLAGVATGAAALLPFVVGSALLAFGFGTINLARVAAAEIFPPVARGRGLGWLLLSATMGAVIGPLFLILSGPIGHLTGRAPLTLVWFIAPPLLLIAAFVLSRITEPRTIAADLAAYHDDVGPVVPWVERIGAGRLLVGGVVALAASQAAMASVMGVAGAAVAHAGHGVTTLGILMFLHFVGMFGLSRFVGRITDRFGRRVTILSGLGILAIGGTVIAGLDTAIGFGIGLLLVGFGWSFGFTGATVLLTDITPPARRARILGRADLGAQLTAAAVAGAGGWWFARSGMPGLGILAIAVVSLPFVAFLLLREPAPGIYGREVRSEPPTERS